MGATDDVGIPPRLRDCDVPKLGYKRIGVIVFFEIILDNDTATGHMSRADATGQGIGYRLGFRHIFVRINFERDSINGQLPIRASIKVKETQGCIVVHLRE